MIDFELEEGEKGTVAGIVIFIKGYYISEKDMTGGP